MTPFNPLDNGVEVNVKVLDIYDGDTITLAMRTRSRELGRFACRIMHINTAEIRTKDAKEKAAAQRARNALAALVLSCDAAELKGVTRHKIRERLGNQTTMHRAKCWGSDKYGRLLVTLATGDCPDVGTYLLENGLAKSYEGKGKKKW